MNVTALLVACVLTGQTGGSGFEPRGSTLQTLPRQNDSAGHAATGSDLQNHSGFSNRNVAPATPLDEERPANTERTTPGTFHSQLRAETTWPTNRVEAPASDARNEPKKTLADAMILEALTPAKDSLLPGKEMPLVDALGKTNDRARRLSITRAYWKLSSAMADYFLAVSEDGQLGTLQPGQQLHADGFVLQTARASSLARIKESQLAVVGAQHELADLLQQAPTEQLPLAADLPLASAYRTYFDKLFANRSAPGRLRQIDSTLPLRLEVIQERAGSVQEAIAATKALQQDHEHNLVGLHAVLNGHTELWRQRRLFLTAVREYNQDIAEYALAVAEPTVNEVTLVSMLIRSKIPPSAARRPAGPSTFAPATRADAQAPSEIMPTSINVPVRPRTTVANDQPPSTVSAAVKDMPSVMKRPGQAAPLEPSRLSRPSEEEARPVSKPISDWGAAEVRTGAELSNEPATHSAQDPFAIRQKAAESTLETTPANHLLEDHSEMPIKHAPQPGELNPVDNRLR